MGREIGRVLGEIVDDEITAGRPMLSAVAVGTNGRPGSGFFELGRQLGRVKEGQTEDEFWTTEREAAYAAWRRPLPK